MSHDLPIHIGYCPHLRALRETCVLLFKLFFLMISLLFIGVQLCAYLNSIFYLFALLSTINNSHLELAANEYEFYMMSSVSGVYRASLFVTRGPTWLLRYNSLQILADSHS
jgi:hypothetical protein